MKKDVIRFERILNESSEILNELEIVLDRIEQNQNNYNELKKYYGSEEYFRDVEISNNSDEYDDIDCGVLTEDLVYDLIGRSYDISIKMLEVATKILKEH